MKLKNKYFLFLNYSIITLGAILILSACEDKRFGKATDDVIIKSDTLTIEDDSLKLQYITNYVDQGIVFNKVSITANQNEVTKINYKDYYPRNVLIASIDSIFESGRLVELSRKLSNDDSESYSFDQDGNYIFKSISIHYDEAYVITQARLVGTEWKYSIVIDGRPPLRRSADEKNFIDAYEIYAMRLKHLVLKYPGRLYPYPLDKVN